MTRPATFALSLQAATSNFRASSALAAVAAAMTLSLAGGATATTQPAPALMPAMPSLQGIVFRCSNAELEAVDSRLSEYFAELDIEPEWLTRTSEPGLLAFTLKTHPQDTDTLNLIYRAEYRIRPETVNLSKPGERAMARDTVSRKEIVLALAQHGRTTQFTGRACNAQAFIDHVGVRQNTVAWSQNLQWGWPEGGSAKWNDDFWHRGTPRDLNRTVDALRDTFVRQEKYEIGCYTATKLAVAHGVVDFYARAQPAQEKLEVAEALLHADGDPLVSIEPGLMWSFEADSTPEDRERPGKLLNLLHDVAPKNFVPGDWAYMLNPDPVSYAKTGYEGSNAIYLGGGRFDDYYNDNFSSYRYKEKLNEVYQWRNGVFSRKRDWAKRQVLTPDDYETLGLPPEKGGLVLAYRAVPRYFGFEDPVAR